MSCVRKTFREVNHNASATVPVEIYDLIFEYVKKLMFPVPWKNIIIQEPNCKKIKSNCHVGHVSTNTKSYCFVKYLQSHE